MKVIQFTRNVRFIGKGRSVSIIFAEYKEGYHTSKTNICEVFEEAVMEDPQIMSVDEAMKYVMELVEG